MIAKKGISIRFAILDCKDSYKSLDYCGILTKNAEVLLMRNLGILSLRVEPQ